MRPLHVSVNAQFGAGLFVGPLSAPEFIGENPDWILDGLAQPAVLSFLVRNHLSALEDHVTGRSSGGVLAVSQGLTDLVDRVAGGATIGSQEMAGLLSQRGDGPNGEGGVGFSGSGYSLAGFPDSGTGEPVTTEQDGAGTGAPSELLVQFAPGVSAAGIARAASAIGGEVLETIHTSAMIDAGEGVLVRMTIGAGVGLEQAIQGISHRPGVEFAEPNWGVSVEAMTSNDPAYTDGKLWGMYGDTTSPANEYGSQAGEAWATDYVGSFKTVAGVVDTGIDYTHPDLYLNVWLNQKEIPTAIKNSLTDVDADGLFTFADLNAAINSDSVTDHNKNGYIDAGDLLADNRWVNGINDDGIADVAAKDKYLDDLIGWDFVNNDNDPYDDHGHGTHVSGTIGGVGGNGKGVAGVAWDVQLMGLKFLNASGSGSLSNAIKALDYYTTAGKLTTQDFVATNNSWGGGGFSQALLDSIVRGAKADVLFVAAAGNGGINGRGDDNDKTAHYPSNYNTESGAGYDAVIAVASITSSGALSTFSNYGDETVDLGAPGQSIYSTLPGGYGTYSGTSMATPHVTGAIALYAAASGAGAKAIKTAVLGSTARTESLVGKTVTDGRLDAGNLMDDFGPTSPTGPAAPSVTGISLDSGVSGTDAITSDQTLIVSGTAEPGVAIEVFRNGVSIGNTTAHAITGDWSFDHTTETLPAASYDFTAKATSNGVTSATSQALTVVVDIDTATPGVNLIAASDTGTSSTDNITSDETPTFKGPAEVGATVELKDADSNAVWGTAIAGADERWTFTPSLPLDDGSYKLVATATDLAGNVSQPSDPLTVHIDSTAPIATVNGITVAGDDVIDAEESTGDVLIQVTVDQQVATGEKVYVLIGDSLTKHEATPDGTDTTGLTHNVSLPYAELSGSSTVTSFVEDLAGNASAAHTEPYTTEEVAPNYVYGTDGSDNTEATKVVGTTGDDIISGLAEGSTTLGSGTVDILFGNGGDDVFVFGDSRGAYYNDDKGRPDNGTSDYGQIDDFSSRDQIQLFAGATYLFLESIQGGISGTGIYIDFKGEGTFDSQDELIGLVAGIAPLDVDYFYVG